MSAPEIVDRRAAPAAAHPAGSAAALAPGTRLAEFELRSVLGRGSCSVVYLAHDLALDRPVAIREYLPSSLVTRAGLRLIPRSPADADAVGAGLRSFVDEARLLAGFDHPSLVKVLRCWEDNATAYTAMPHYQGVPLPRRLAQLGAPPPPPWLRGLLAPLIDALATIHAAGRHHGNINPEHVILLAGSDRPLLLEPGAARRVVADLGPGATAIVAPGYAPIEQVAPLPHRKLGAWTDVYSLCALAYCALTGRAPPPATGRTINDSFSGLAHCARAGYESTFLHAIERGLAVHPEQRTASAPQLAAELGLRRGVAVESPAVVVPAATGSPCDTPAAKRIRAARDPTPQSDSAPAGARIPVPQVERRPGADRFRWWPRVGLAAGLLATGAIAGAWLASRGSQAAHEAAPMTATGTAPAATVIPAAPLARSVTVSATAAAATPIGARIESEFRLVEAGRIADWQIEAAPEQPRLRIGRDRLAFRIHSDHDGFIYVLLHGPDDTLTLLYPNRVDAANFVRAGQTLRLPGAAWPLVASDPPGVESFLAIVSAHRRDFSAARPVPDAWFQRLVVDPAGSPIAAPGRPLYAGVADCTGAGCDRYGTARFTLSVER